jgi:hypothetical protein
MRRDRFFSACIVQVTERWRYSELASLAESLSPDWTSVILVALPRSQPEHNYGLPRSSLAIERNEKNSPD